MGKAKRADEGGAIYHMLNRANRRATIFHKDADYEAFERIIAQALDRVQLKLFSFCLVPKAFGRQTRSRWRKDSFRSMVGADAYPALQFALSHHR